MVKAANLPAAAFAIVLGCGSAAAAEIRVRPGDDVAAAIIGTRATPAPRAVIFETGRFEVVEPLRLTAADSGLTLAAAADGKAVIAGSRRIGGWRLADPVRGLWQAEVGGAGKKPVRFRQLFVDGRRAQRARTPNEGFLRAQGPLGNAQPMQFPCGPGVLNASWPTVGGVELVFLQKWVDARLEIKAVDPGANRATLEAQAASWMDEADCRYFIENAPEALDAPGEWYLDPRSGVLSYIGGPKFDGRTATITAASTDVLLEISDCDGVNIRGLVFAEADDWIPDGGRIDPQAAALTRGVIQGRGSDNGTIENCVIENVGLYAIDVGAGCHGWKLLRNTLRDLGAGGVRIGETRPADPAGGISVVDTVVERFGRTHTAAVGILILHSGDNRISHNHIYDGYYTGISVGWTWGYRESPCRGNIIEFNHVHQIGQGMLSDMGGIYTLGPQPGTIVRNNYFHDVVSFGYGGWGLYTDEGSSGIVMEKNVAARCKSAGFHQHYGRDNIVRNNLFAFNREFSLMRSRAEGHRSFTFERNVVIADSGTWLGSQWLDGAFESDRNLWWDTRHAADPAANRMAGKTWAEWQAGGHDVHSVIADPRLVDPGHPERGWRPDSPAVALGIEPIDLSGIGPRPQRAPRR